MYAPLREPIAIVLSLDNSMTSDLVLNTKSYRQKQVFSLNTPAVYDFFY